MFMGVNMSMLMRVRVLMFMSSFHINLLCARDLNYFMIFFLF